MKRKVRLFFWLSALLAGLALLAFSNWLPALLVAYGGEPPLIHQGLSFARLQFGLAALGFSLILFHTLLLLLGKALSESYYFSLYGLVMLICLLIGTYIATF